MTQAPRMADDLLSPEGVPPDDAAVIAESRRVPDRFGAVFDRHAVPVHGYIARRLGPDAADDLVAETFLVAFRKRADYDLGQHGSGLACSYAHLQRVPTAVQRAVITTNPMSAEPNGATQESWTIHPHAMPPGSSILFADWVSSAFSTLMFPTVLSTNAAPVCQG